MKLYEIILNGRYVDTIAAKSAKIAKSIAERHFGQIVTVKAQRKQIALWVNSK